MTSSLRFNGIRVLFALLLGLCFVLGAHASGKLMDNEHYVQLVSDLDNDAWPVRCTPKTAPKPAS